ncbi:hypothetical protein FQN57_003473 [Myotisia sp. PD_48]|nr:hypothetical protein FQN57_003473 [Myotisia sp. PD_48]
MKIFSIAGGFLLALSALAVAEPREDSVLNYVAYLGDALPHDHLHYVREEPEMRTGGEIEKRKKGGFKFGSKPKPSTPKDSPKSSPKSKPKHGKPKGPKGSKSSASTYSVGYAAGALALGALLFSLI